MSEPLISVIIPAFNAAPTLAESLRSVQAQTFKNFEVIIVDDGSTDETADISRHFCAQDARFTIISQANGGPSVARNTALDVARGGWIAFQDADDVWFPAKLDKQIELARQHPDANLIYTNLYFWDGARDLYPGYKLHKPLPDGDMMRTLIFRDLYLTSSLLVRREALAAVGPFDPELRLSQDWDLRLRLGENGLNARGVREPMVRYRRWTGSNTMRRMEVADTNIRLLEKNLTLTRREEYRKLYRRSIANAHAVRELARAYTAPEKSTATMAAAALRAWKCNPRLKWLRWYLLLVWPVIIGGHATRRMVERKFDHVCRGY